MDDASFAVGAILGLAVGIPVGWFLAQVATGGFGSCESLSKPPPREGPWKTVVNLEAWEMWEDESGRLHAEVRRKVKRVE